jgi:hypothetical protein
MCIYRSAHSEAWHIQRHGALPPPWTRSTTLPTCIGHVVYCTLRGLTTAYATLLWRVISIQQRYLSSCPISLSLQHCLFPLISLNNPTTIFIRLLSYPISRPSFMSDTSLLGTGVLPLQPQPAPPPQPDSINAGKVLCREPGCNKPGNKECLLRLCVQHCQMKIRAGSSSCTYYRHLQKAAGTSIGM